MRRAVKLTGLGAVAFATAILSFQTVPRDPVVQQPETIYITVLPEELPACLDTLAQVFSSQIEGQGILSAGISSEAIGPRVTCVSEAAL